MIEGHLHQVANGMADSGGDDVVVGLALLEHQPHRLDVVAGKSPVARGVEIAEEQLVGPSQLDAGDAVRDLARDELEPAPRRLVVEEHAGNGKQVVAFAIVDRDVVREDF